MTERLRVACIQVNAGNELEKNLKVVADFVRVAKARGAHLVLMPEHVAMMAWKRDEIIAGALSANNHTALVTFRALAMELCLWLHCGTIIVLESDSVVVNRTYVLRPNGTIAAVYDKLHMFDVDLGDRTAYRESLTFLPGDRAVVAKTPWGGLGLSVCYDLRFPQLYRALAHGGASFFAVPAAFTRTTGVAHWHVLLRARAIENGCYIFAPAQTGTHVNNRQTYGHSLIIDPWGKILADAGDAPGLILAEVETARVQWARDIIPSLRHDRPFALP
ncbi:FIG147869: Carbon-nitrogen hydrolase / Aliphatic amidase AmiE [invertebrate metagenome]|uniref:FIG147869: Carbon-nitrogen hydrolase / Aliphatic amidase AmiE n=1 Tax=invertebrate metagenome TaxID=1711999 RepID=A0A484H4N1_9ZZZZ